MYRIKKDQCVDCGFCSYVCPFGAIEHNLDGKFYFINEEKCKKCGQCFKSCIGGFIEKDDDDKAILNIYISDSCIGCSICQKNCPNNAITGVLKSKFEIHDDKCIKCGLCASKCPKKAIVVVREK